MTTTSHFSLCSIYGCGKKRFSKKRTYKEISPSTPQVGHRDAVQRIIKERSFFEIKYGRQAMTPIVSCTERVRLFWLTTQLLLVNDSIKLFPICLIPSYKSEEDHRNYPEHQTCFLRTFEIISNFYETRNCMVTSYVQIQNHISRTTQRNYKEID